MQAKMFEDKCKELRDELKDARDEIDRLNAQIGDMVPRAELIAARKVSICTPRTFLLQCLHCEIAGMHLSIHEMDTYWSCSYAIDMLMNRPMDA